VAPVLTASVTRVTAQQTTAERDWVADLRAERAGTIEELHGLLLRAARFEVSRRRGGLPHTDAAALDDLAHQAADDALTAILAKLDTFRGESRFTTWAYKFALLEAGVRMRRRAWHEREVMLDDDAWPRVSAAQPGPAETVETREELNRVTAAMRDVLTRHQREVLIAVALDGVPIDVLAERLGTTRGALYKTIHDARRKLRATLEGDRR
jgi:RNA polymerase sigma-70 factor, ECF subfamily